MCFQSNGVINKCVGFHYFTPNKTVVLELVIITGGIFEVKSPLPFLYFNFVGFLFVINKV